MLTEFIGAGKALVLLKGASQQCPLATVTPRSEKAQKSGVRERKLEKRRNKGSHYHHVPRLTKPAKEQQSGVDKPRKPCSAKAPSKTK